MSRSTSTNVLADPEIQRHTERILTLQDEERQTREKLGSVIAAIGSELVAVKEALDKTTDKTAWLRWLKDHVHYSADTAQRYMRVARFAEKNRNAAVFFGLDPTVLSGDVTVTGKTREEFATDTLRIMGRLSDQMTGIRGRKGSLTGDSKQRVLAALHGNA